MPSKQNKIINKVEGNKKFLLKEAGYKSITEFKNSSLKNDFPLFKNDDKIYKYLLNEHNRILLQLQEQREEEEYEKKMKEVIRKNHDRYLKGKKKQKHKEEEKTLRNDLKEHASYIKTNKKPYKIESAYKSYVSYMIPTNRYIVRGNIEDALAIEVEVKAYAEIVYSLMLPVIKKELAEKKMIKVYTSTPVCITDPPTSITKADDKSLFSKPENDVIVHDVVISKYEIVRASDIPKYRKYFIGSLVHLIIIKLDTYKHIKWIDSTKLNIIKFTTFEGKRHAPIPKFISDTKGVVNIKNKDEKCFLWSLIASRHPAESHVDRISNYDKPEYISEWKFKDRDIPMKIDRIQFFERANKVNINVYTVEDNQNYTESEEIHEDLRKEVDDIFGEDSDDENNKTNHKKKQEKQIRLPLYISKQNNEEVVNLFYYNEHYSLIKNFSRFCGADGNFTCPNCLTGYSNRESYKGHVENCRFLNENGTLVCMPKDIKIKDKEGNEKLIKPQTYFKKFNMMKKLPVVLYADFESNIEATEEIHKGVIAKHVPNSFRLHVESSVDLGIETDYEYSGKDCPERFIELIINNLEDKIQSKLKELNEKNYEPVLTNEEEKEFQKSSSCHLCEGKIVYKEDKVRDHDHFTGKYEGCAHKKCNIKAHQMFKGKIKVPIFFHNVNYDLKCLIQAFHNIKGDDIKKLNALPCNMENYKSLSINSYEICCSYAHLSLSLDKLIKNLPDDKKIRLRKISGDDEEKFKLINKKGFYPYELITSFDKLLITIDDIKQEDFKSKLTLSELSNEDWEHVKKVISVFNIKSFKEYHDLYLKIDVLGLTDVFEYYRELSFNTYGLDPAHCIGLPQYTWMCGLKYTKIRLDELQDQDMYIFFEKMKRGGISVISHKYAKANNHYLPDFDENKTSSYLMQFDANSLYSYAMYESLPTSNFSWENPEEWNSERILSYDDNSNIGYGFEVDLIYPDDLHDEHNDYPLAPEKLIIDKIGKLAPNFMDKKGYNVHIRNLKYYLEKGLVITKIHKVVKFSQSKWLKPYIQNNITLRQASKNDFEKDFYKLMNNAFFGKTMENIRDRVNVKFCLDQKSYEKNISSPLFASKQNLFAQNPDEDGLRLVQMHKKTVTLNKPLYVGAAIMELSKVHMFKFHYDTMKELYPKSVMMKTDTDSLLYYIETPDLYEDMKTIPSFQQQVEFSNYPKDHMLYNSDRKKEAGLFQDECVDGEFVVISEYCGLRAKSYANELYNVTKKEYETKKKSKGVPSLHIKKRVTFNDYKKCLGVDNNFVNTEIRLGDKNDENEKLRDKIYCFRSFNMQMYSVEMSKIALCAKDDKRYLQDDKIHTYALGHYKIPK